MRSRLFFAARRESVLVTAKRPPRESAILNNAPLHWCHQNSTLSLAVTRTQSSDRETMNDRTTLKNSPGYRKPPSLFDKAGETIYRLSKRAIPALIVAVILFALFRPVYIFDTDSARESYLRSIGAPTDNRIIILTAEWCPACKQLEGTLESEGVHFLKLDIERTKAGEELFRKVSQQTLSNSIPKIIIDNRVVGPSRALMEIKALKAANR